MNVQIEFRQPDSFRAASGTEAVEFAERLAGIVLGCLHREYPNKIAHVLESDADVQPPRKLTPAFCGCFDWHSAVHSHWCLVRLIRCFPQAHWSKQAASALDRRLTPEHIRGELEYLNHPGREGFERPYGLAWLLQLSTELKEWNGADARRWQQILEPLERLAAERFARWLPRLSYPVRTGEHTQTAFAMGLALDWARRTPSAQEFATLLSSRAADFYVSDHGSPLAFEPSGHDFLSPSLAEADLMRRVLPAARFAEWLSEFLPQIPSDAAGPVEWLQPVVCPDASEGKLAHLDGLNLSRAWMLEGIASALPAGDGRHAALRAASGSHACAGLASVTGEHYAGAHWLPSFAVYLLTRRGLDPNSPRRLVE